MASVGPLCVVESVALVVKPVLASAAEAKRDGATIRSAVVLRPSRLKAAQCLASIYRPYYTKNLLSPLWVSSSSIPRLHEEDVAATFMRCLYSIYAISERTSSWTRVAGFMSDHNVPLTLT